MIARTGGSVERGPPGDQRPADHATATALNNTPGSVQTAPDAAPVRASGRRASPGALLIEQKDEWLVCRRYLSEESMRQILTPTIEPKHAASKPHRR
jgi:hypothetical protein